jgi:hypothetical protein
MTSWDEAGRSCCHIHRFVPSSVRLGITAWILGGDGGVSVIFSLELMRKGPNEPATPVTRLNSREQGTLAASFPSALGQSTSGRRAPDMDVKPALSR